MQREEDRWIGRRTARDKERLVYEERKRAIDRLNERPEQ